MGLTDAQKRERKEDPNVLYVTNRIVNKDSKKPFVFISYKSDDWKAVLQDVVYRLVKEYGLNVYFDGDFDTHNSLWIDQFPENMESPQCKGVLVFISNKYATSYATLMELMHSQTLLAARGSKNEGKGLPVVPVNLEGLNKDKVSYADTGLGQTMYEDGSTNGNANAEKKCFDAAFMQLTRRKVLEQAIDLYNNTRSLSCDVCFDIFQELKASLHVNDNVYFNGGSLDSIVASIKDACGDEVFNRTLPHVTKITDETTLREIEEFCEYPDFCRKLRDIKKTEDYSAGAFYYLFAVLLRGCDGPVCKYPSKPGEEAQISNRAKWNFGTYVVSRDVNLEQPVLNTGIFTWTTACRHRVGIEKSGNLGEYSKVFNNLDINTTLGDIKSKFENPSGSAYKTDKNDEILKAIERLKGIDIPDSIIG